MADVIVTHKAMDVWRDETPQSKQLYIIPLYEQDEQDKILKYLLHYSNQLLMLTQV